MDVDTFARFCEYLYSGDYTPAEHEIVLDPSLFPPEKETKDAGNEEAGDSGDSEDDLAISRVSFKQGSQKLKRRNRMKFDGYDRVKEA